MASDRARISFDPTRDYRSVIAQQGRVTLEADVNEAAMIATEALRLETIDIVGPDGTPDNGYAVTMSGGVTIGAGTMYLGGWRLTLAAPAAPVNINAQPDWLDGPTFTPGTNDVVSLLITEQSVCAVEDQALREIALGGPDTAARYRLMQHFLLTGMDGDTCDDGLTAVEAALAADGCSLDPKTDQILSGATLQAGFVAPTTPPDPCSPAAAGGYLGADNQLVRVTVTSFVAGQTGTLLWGWNNASFLYRATLSDPGAGVFTLTGAPVDEEHAPQLGQAVEILRTRADLGDGNYIAADAGFVTTVAQAYSFDTGRFTIADPGALPADYAGAKTPLFVRLWQAEVPFTPGQPAPLDTVSGLTVTVELTALPTQIAARPFWRFAVRPDNPAQIYPERYLDGPQPPDGPRQWICDLAVVQGGRFGEAAGQGGGEVLADCRKSFNPLTDDKGGCCGLALDPEGVDALGGLQAVVDSLAGAGGAVLSLKAGTYLLPGPLLLGPEHAGITIEGCSTGVIFEANPAELDRFILGMVITLDARGVTLEGIDFLVPNAPVAGQPGAVGSTICLGVLSLRTAGLTVEACRFRFVPPEGAAFGAGVAALGPVEGLTVRECDFAARALAENHLLFGVLSTVTGEDVSTGLDAVDIRDNLFENLSAGVTAFARLGMIRCQDNRVKACGVGLFFAASNIGGASQFAREASMTDDRAAFADGGLTAGVQAGVQADLLARTAAAAAPLFTKLANPAPEKVSATARRVLVRDMNAKGTRAWADLAAARLQTAKAADAATAKAAAAPRAGRKAATSQTAAARKAAASANLAYTGALDRLETLSMAAEVYQNPLLPVLHIVGNDIALVSPGQTPGVGIGVLFSPKAEVGEVLLSGNRVTTPDTATVAASVMFPAFATATGNMLLQPPNYDGGQTTPAFVLIGDGDSALLAPMGNVVRNVEWILPPRASSAVETTWEFLNTES